MDSSENQNIGKCGRLKIMQLIIAVCLVLNSIGYAYVQDIPGSLQDALMNSLHLSSTKFSLFYSIYALPCLFISTVGGFLIDSAIGLRNTSIIFLITILIGSVFYAVGAPLNNFPLMLVGRFLLGSGLETLIGPCVVCYIFIWFKEDHINLIFSLTDNFCYIGTMLVYALSSRIYDAVAQYYSDAEALTITQVTNSCVILVSLSCLGTVIFTTKSDGVTKKRGKPRFTDFLKFPPAFWIICFEYACTSNAIYTFENFSQVFFMTEYGMTATEASNPTSFMNLIIIALAIPLGFIVDRIGRNTLFLISSIIVALISHTCMIYHVNPYLSMTMLGAAYAMIASSVWSTVGYLLDESNYGFGYGIQFSLFNCTSFIVPIIAGKIIDDHGFIWAQIFYLILLAMGMLSLVLMRIIDSQNYRLLSMSAQERKLNDKKLSSQSTNQLTESINNQENYGSVERF